MEQLAGAIGVSIGLSIASGIKFFISVFMGYAGLKLAVKLFGPFKLIQK